MTKLSQFVCKVVRCMFQFAREVDCKLLFDRNEKEETCSTVSKKRKTRYEMAESESFKFSKVGKARVKESCVMKEK